jgi:hypothetical protein
MATQFGHAKNAAAISRNSRIFLEDPTDHAPMADRTNHILADAESDQGVLSAKDFGVCTDLTDSFMEPCVSKGEGLVSTESAVLQQGRLVLSEHLAPSLSRVLGRSIHDELFDVDPPTAEDPSYPKGGKGTSFRQAVYRFRRHPEHNRHLRYR